MDDDQTVLDDLRKSADQQSNIDFLQLQYLKSRDMLLESYAEQSGTLLRFKLKPSNAVVPDDENDENANNLVSYFQLVRDNAQQKFDEIESSCADAKDKLSKVQRTVSDKTVLLGSKQQSHAAMKFKLDSLTADGGCLSRARVVVEELRRLDSSPAAFGVSEESPQQLR
jgi:hypothetical protein